MRATVTKKFLKDQKACKQGYEYFLTLKEKSLFVVLDQCIKDKHSDWANWLIVRCMDRKQYIAYAIFSAESVLGEYEKYNPVDDRPSIAIEAAKKVLSRNTKENRAAARAAGASESYFLRNPRSFLENRAAARASWASEAAVVASWGAAAWAAGEAGEAIMVGNLRFGIELMKEAKK